MQEQKGKIVIDVTGNFDVNNPEVNLKFGIENLPLAIAIPALMASIEELIGEQAKEAGASPEEIEEMRKGTGSDQVFTKIKDETRN